MVKKLFALLLSAFALCSCTAPVPDDNGKKPDEQVDPNPEPEPEPEPEPGPEPGGKTLPLRVMSFNILQGGNKSVDAGVLIPWSERRGGVFSMFKEIAPDIACLQECRREQLNDLKANCTAYTYYQYAKDGVKAEGVTADNCTDDSIWKNKGQRDVIMLRKGVFDMLDWGYYWFSETPKVSSYSGALYSDGGTPKLSLWLKLLHKETQHIIYVWDTHFFPNGTVGRKQCALDSVSYMKEIAGDNSTIFFCGDLNLEPENASLQPLFDWMSSARFKAPDTDDSKTSNGYRESNWKSLDHIFYRGATAKVYRVEDSETKYGVRFISDHFPIWCDFDVAL